MTYSISTCCSATGTPSVGHASDSTWTFVSTVHTPAAISVWLHPLHISAHLPRCSPHIHSVTRAALRDGDDSSQLEMKRSFLYILCYVD